MDKKLLLLGAVSAIALMGGLKAAVAQEAARVMAVTSYSELFTPIPNASLLLEVVDATVPLKAEKVQWGYHHHHHHHGWGHHHHNWHHHGWHHHEYYGRPWGWRHRHHHHHHHHHGGFRFEFPE